jgi:hypothetical protein
MPRKLTRKRLAIAAGAVLTVVIAGTAYAFWSSGGSGTGSASVGDPGAQSVSISQTGSINNLSPGGSAQTVSGTVSNPNGNAVHVGTITASITGTSNPGCPASEFSLPQATATVNQTLAANTGTASFTGITVRLAETGVNQDDCKGVSISLGFSSD